MEETKFLEFIESIQVLEMKPGDVVVLRVDKKIPTEYYMALNKAVKNVFVRVRKTDDIGVIILEPDLDIGIMREVMK